MAKKEDYIKQNREFLKAKREEEGIKEISLGVLRKIIKSGKSNVRPRQGNVVTVHYKGTLINGKEFDNSYKRSCPEAFRVRDLIVGFQVALTQMTIGDHWIVYIPCEQGYGMRSAGNIPGGSTLVFEIELLGVN
ncbi:MAG: FKBP-type peptidyl-prolyl cis-trans isomerase [Bacteroidales bacterium]|nr:FKBP-type peptidyl-prolyl cis-trans isomerase [Bacteroidales bacterium]